MCPHHSHEPLCPCQGAGEFQAGRKAFTETPSHSFPPRDAISSDTLPRRDLHGKFHGRLPSLLCSLKPAAGLCSHTTLAQELVAVPSLGTPCWGTPCPGCAQPGRDDAVPGNRSCWQRFRAARPAPTQGRWGLTCMIPHCWTQVFHRTRKFRGFPNLSAVPSLTDNAGMCEEENNRGST